MNIFKVKGYGTRYYLTHPWYWLREWRKKLVFAWQRITRGYADWDVWDLDQWMLEILPRMLDQLADNTHTYPLDIGDKEWSKYLHGLASNLRLCTDEAADKLNEYYDEFHNNLILHTEKKDDGFTHAHVEINDEIRDNYFKRCKEIWQEIEAIREETFADIGRSLPEMWD